MPLAILAAIRTCVCVSTSVAAAYLDTWSSSRCPFSWFARMFSSSYTKLSAMIPRLSFGLRIMIASATRLLAYSGYFTGTRILSSSLSNISLPGIFFSLRIKVLAAPSVITDEMIQVIKIMITTALRISSVMRYRPGATCNCIPTITIAMAPAA